jgi:hypothetical protein
MPVGVDDECSTDVLGLEVESWRGTMGKQNFRRGGVGAEMTVVGDGGKDGIEIGGVAELAGEATGEICELIEAFAAVVDGEGGEGGVDSGSKGTRPTGTNERNRGLAGPFRMRAICISLSSRMSLMDPSTLE